MDWTKQVTGMNAGGKEKIQNNTDGQLIIAPCPPLQFVLSDRLKKWTQTHPSALCCFISLAGIRWDSAQKVALKGNSSANVLRVSCWAKLSQGLSVPCLALTKPGPCSSVQQAPAGDVWPVLKWGTEPALLSSAEVWDKLCVQNSSLCYKTLEGRGTEREVNSDCNSKSHKWHKKFVFKSILLFPN